MFTGPNASLLQRRFSLFVDPSNGTPPYMVNLQAEWGPMQFVTANGTNGSNLSSRMRINGYNVGNTLNGFTNQITSGFVGISADPTFWTAGTSTQTPASLLHLVGDFNGHNPFAYRPWMKNGISFTLGWDQGFIGPRLVNDENDVMEFVVGWGDNASTYGPDVMSFRFLANEGGGGQDLLGEDLDGREILRMGGSGNIGIGPRFNNLFMPQSTLHQHQENAISSYYQISNQFLATGSSNNAGPTAVTNADGLRLGIVGSATSNANGAGLLYNQENRPLLFSSNANTNTINLTSGITNERFRITSTGTPTQFINGSIQCL